MLPLDRASIRAASFRCAFSTGECTSILIDQYRSRLPGNGLLLFFGGDDFDQALPRARSIADRLEEQPHLNPNSVTMEFALRDPDGYFVMISALAAT